jgi:hypothetical protein
MNAHEFSLERNTNRFPPGKPPQLRARETRWACVCGSRGEWEIQSERVAEYAWKQHATKETR